MRGRVVLLTGTGVSVKPAASIFGMENSASHLNLSN